MSHRLLAALDLAMRVKMVDDAKEGSRPGYPRAIWAWIVLLALVLGGTSLWGQTYEVQSQQKIADGTGGFGDLTDNDQFGRAVANVGDLDNDGIEDLAVGAFNDDTGGTDRGAVYVLFMDSDGTVKSQQKIADNTGGLGDLANSDLFGSSVAGIGDLDGDGIEDLVVGANGDDTGGAERGAVYVLFMNSNGTVQSYQKIASGIGGFGSLADIDHFGIAVAGIGDLDGDSLEDLVVGAYGDDTGGTYRGAAYVLFLNSNGTVKAHQKIASGTGGFGSLVDIDQFGYAVAGVGDLDGDGVEDIAVGVSEEDTGGTGRGAVYVLFLNIDGTVKGQQKIASGTGGFGNLTNGDHFGNTVAGVGDLDDDGVEDLIVAAPYDDTEGTNRGAVYVLFLNSDGTVKAHQKIASSTGGLGTLTNDDTFGVGAVSVGDLDGDGFEDLAVGANGDDTGGSKRGAVYILFGKMGAFTDVAAGVNVDDSGNGQGAAWGDYDDDGDLDLYLSKWGGANSLYQNNGSGTFTDIGGIVADTGNGYGVVWGDYDNDGDLDLYLSNHNSANQLYRNDGGGAFTEVGSGAGVADTGTGRTAGWGDYDNDGDLDLYLTNYGTNQLYRNDGGGSFAIVGGSTADGGYGMGMAWGDYDDDGDLDLYLTNDGTNHLYRNEGGGTFTDIGGTTADPGSGKGAAWGDYDSDGDLDLYLVTNPANRLYQNDGAGAFTDVGPTAEVDDTGTGMSAAWADYDSDGDLDLYVSNAGANKLFSNDEDETFTEIGTAAGVDNANDGRAVVWGDYDGDGDLDLYLANSSGVNRLYQNRGNTNRWLQVDLTGNASNWSGIGAQVLAVTGSDRQRQDVDGGSGYLSQSSLPVEFGFGNTATVDSLIVEWPSGLITVQTDVMTNQVLSITEPEVTTFSDVGAGINVADPGGESRGVAWGDYDGDGDLDLYVAKLGANKLYRNSAGASFEDVGAAMLIDDGGNGHGIAWGDYDNDGDLDLYQSDTGGQNRLFRNDGVDFQNVAPAVGIVDSGPGQGVAWGDFDNDGFLDLYIARAGASLTNRLYQNNGGSAFTEVSSGAQVADPSDSRGVAWGDFDDDGDLDLYVANDGANRLYRNEGNNTFTDDAGNAGVDGSADSQGATWGDYDGDGDLDLYVANPTGTANSLFQNQGDETFLSMEGSAGVGDTGLGEDVAWGDCDNDGDLDLYVSNYGSANRLYVNNGDGNFAELGQFAGVADGGNGFGATWGDYDGDGDLDLYVSNYGSANLLYQNQGNGNHWLQVELEGTVSNRDGIGVKLFATVGTDQLRLDVDGGSGYFSQPSLPVEFGLGSAAVVDELRVEWPSGIVQTLTNVATDQLLTLEEIPTIDVSVPHVTATYNQTLQIPVQVTDTSGGGIVSAEVFVSYDGDLLTAFSTGLTGTLAESGWSAETNVAEGNGTSVDTVKIAMATDDDVLSGAGNLIHITFQVGDVRSPAASLLTLEHVLFNDGTPPNTTMDGSVTLVGVDGTIVHDLTEIIPRESIAVTVTDADEDRNPGGQDSFTVRVSNGSQSETLTVLETDISTGVFAGTINTAFSLGSTTGDGIVQAKAGDVIQSCYDDWLDAAGNTIERCASTNVIGGTDGAIRVTIVSQPGDTVRVRVTDADLNINSSAPENAQVTATNPTTGESETIDLAEDGDNSDVFFGLLFTAPGSTAGAPDDATLNTAKGDVIGVTYSDVVTEQGGTEDLTDDDDVVDPFGDADGNGSVQAFDAAKVLLHALTPYLTGLDSLGANLDLLAFDPVQGAITPYDASLILQKRVGLIGRFPVQEDEADNHPQPETDDSMPKSILDERLLSLQVHDGYLSVWMDEREEIVSGELLVEGIEGEVEMGEELSDFLSASRETADGLRVVFAGASPVEGSGELLRIYSGVGPGNVRLTRARFNDGRIVFRIGETERSGSIPRSFALHPNVPNPFNPETTIRFELPYRVSVRLEVFDVLGQRVLVLVDEVLSRGRHEAMWDGRDQAGISVSSGLYLYRLQAEDLRSDASRQADLRFEQVRRMLLLK
jgi:hypothetical protein